MVADSSLLAFELVGSWPTPVEGYTSGLCRVPLFPLGGARFGNNSFEEALWECFHNCDELKVIAMTSNLRPDARANYRVVRNSGPTI